MEMCGWCRGCFWASVGSGHNLATLSLPEGIHTYLMTRALGSLWQDARRIGFWGTRCGGWWHDDRRSHYMQDVVLNLLSYGHEGIVGSCRRIVHRLLLIFHCLPGSLTREPLGETSHH